VLFTALHPWQRKGRENALDGKPRFDLTRFNQDYFDRLRARVDAARKNGIYVSIMLFEGWAQRFTSDGYRGYPFNSANNVNGIDCDANRDGKGLECFTLGNPAVRAIQEAYVRHVIDTVNDLDNVLYEISNENHWDSYEWERHFVDYIRQYEKGKPKQHPVGMTSNGGGGQDDTARLLNSPADWISPNSLSFDYKENPPAAVGPSVVVIDTDHIWGLGGDRAWVWKSFVRGLNPIFMDPYREQLMPVEGDEKRQQLASVREAMGQTALFAARLDMNAAVPLPELASTGYCLASPGVEYLVYLPPQSNSPGAAGVSATLQQPLQVVRSQFVQSARVDLSASAGNFSVEWFNPSNGETIAGGVVRGGDRRSFSAPFTGDAVLYLKLQN
jgi:uncharacterized protein DUF6298